MTDNNDQQIHFSKEDLRNLKYILSIQAKGEDELDKVLNSMPEDDLHYALELLRNFVTMRENFVNSIG